MQQLSIPTCYFPSTALFLDDSHDFLLNFVLQLDERVAYRIFDAPRKALDYIHNKGCALDLISQHCLSEYTAAKQYSMLHQNKLVNLDMAPIYAEVYNPYRFAEISVVVVDYAMPGMDGLEFCRLIENSNIKKILLTGQADEKLAIKAFNEGLIHRYIKKSDVNAAQLITQSIYELQLQYFQAMSDIVMRMLSLSAPRCLYDQKFVQYFRKIVEEHHITEYYLIDHAGSFCMLDDDANVSFLIVKREEELRLYYDNAVANGVKEGTLQQFAKGEMIPAFWQANSDATLWENIDKYLVPVKRLLSDETYFIAYLKGNVFFDARQQKILSYHRYLEELDAEELLVE